MSSLYTLKTTNTGKKIMVFNGDPKDIRNIAFEPITVEYSWGHYEDLTVIINNENGYMNASHACKQGEEQVRNWMSLTQSEELINCLSVLKKIPVNELIVTITGGDEPIIAGTYVHPILFPHIIMSQISSKVADIVNEHLIKEKLCESV